LLESDVSQSLHCSFIYTKGGGTQPDRVRGLGDRQLDSSPTVASSLKFQNKSRVLEGWTLASQYWKLQKYPASCLMYVPDSAILRWHAPTRRQICDLC